MNSKLLVIRAFVSSDTDAVNKLIRGIQQVEFGFPSEEFPQPELYDIAKFYMSFGGNFWVAQLGDVVVGTAGLLNCGNGVAKLGKMFVCAECRGKPQRVAQKLLDVAMTWANNRKFTLVCFETTPEPCVAHYFYRKNQFAEVDASKFPPEYKLCSYPSRYFMKRIGCAI